MAVLIPLDILFSKFNKIPLMIIEKKIHNTNV